MTLRVCSNKSCGHEWVLSTQTHCDWCESEGIRVAQKASKITMNDMKKLAVSMSNRPSNNNKK